MTDDLVKRLREVKDWWREPGRTAEQAADRIEALETALWQLLDDMGDDGLCVCWQAKEEARAALGEKKE